MVKVVGVRFREAGKIYYFDPEDLELSDGDKVIVETVRGLEFGEVVGGADMVPEDKITSPLKKVIRKATPEDNARVEANREKEKKAFEIALDKIEAHGLPMKLVDVEYTFDNTKIIFFFTSDGRVDFRELVRDLAGVFRTRIELRQIGVRDEAKMVGGLGTCGRLLCCVTFLGDFEPVSIRMAKDQNLSLNPSKISGMCGRLMCCLRYEHEIYQELRKALPSVGSEIDTNVGTGRIEELNVLLGIATVRMDDGTTVSVDLHKQGDDAKTYQVEQNDDNTLPGELNKVCSSNSQETGKKNEKERMTEEKSPKSEDEPTKKRSTKPRRRRRNRRRKKQGQAQSGEAKQDTSSEKSVKSKEAGASSKTKRDDKDSKSHSMSKPRRRRRRKNPRSSSKPQQETGNASPSKEKLTGTGR